MRTVRLVLALLIAACWIAAIASPALESNRYTLHGLSILAVGWLDLLTGHVDWLGNLGILVTIIRLLNRRAERVIDAGLAVLLVAVGGDIEPGQDVDGDR